MYSSEKGPVDRFVSATWAVLLACVMLWAAVWVIQQIFWWLVGAAVLVGVVWLVVRVARERRDRWLR